jgi:hypothetical protein
VACGTNDATRRCFRHRNGNACSPRVRQFGRRGLQTIARRWRD